MTDPNPKEMGSEEWWQIVLSSQMYEAESLLRQFKAALLSKHAGATTYNDAAAQITRVNNELHRFSQIQNRATMKRAMRNICGDEVYAQVMEEVARIEFMARQEHGAPPC
jgi:hypothetical protein